MREEVIADIKQSINRGYQKLQGEWRDWLEVAKRYEHKVLKQDRLDIRHDIMLELHRARQRDGKPIPKLRAYRIASLVVALYWRQLKRHQAISLNKEVEDEEGNITELIDTVADDKAIDISAWLDTRLWLQGCPLRLIKIGVKIRYGIALTNKERQYLWYFRHKEQKRLF